MRVEIRSKRGNVAIGVLGTVYAISGFVLLIVHLAQTWGAASLTDRGIQVLLILVIALSIWFIQIAARGLGVHLGKRGSRSTSLA